MDLPQQNIRLPGGVLEEVRQVHGRRRGGNGIVQEGHAHGSVIVVQIVGEIDGAGFSEAAVSGKTRCQEKVGAPSESTCSFEQLSRSKRQVVREQLHSGDNSILKRYDVVQFECAIVPFGPNGPEKDIELQRQLGGQHDSRQVPSLFRIIV